MSALDLSKFVWLSKESKKSHIILAITEYRDDDVVVHREISDRGNLYVSSVSDFCREFDATYELN